MALEQNRDCTESSTSPLLFPLLQAALVLLLLRDFLWQDGRILSHGGEGDIFIQFYMWRDFAVTHLLNGEFPFWNPHIFGGIPFFGGMQSALLYPPNALYLLLPLPLAINWSIALHIWLMGLFTTLWLQYGVRLGALAAGMGGIMVMFAGPFFMHIHGGHLSNISVMVWAPLLFLAMERWFAGGSRRWLALGASAVAMQIFAGHPQYLYYTGITVLLLGSWQLLARSTARWRDLLGIVAIYLVGTAIGAVQLLPAMEAAGESVRAGGASLAFAGSFSLPPSSLATLLTPHLLDLATDLTYLWETSLYIGILGLFFSILGFAYHERRRAIGAALLTGLLIVLALGHHTPLFGLLYHTLPGFDLFRGTTKFAFFALLFAAALAAMGIRRLQQMPPPQLAPLAAPLLVVAISLAIALLSLQLLGKRGGIDSPLFNHPAGVTTLNRDLLFAIALLSVAALLIRIASRTMRHTLPLLLLLFVTELYLNAATHLVWFDAQTARHHPVVAALQKLPSDIRVHNQIHRNAAMLGGSGELWGNDPGLARRWAEFVAHTSGFATPENQSIIFSAQAPQLAIARLGGHLVNTQDGVALVPATTPPLPRAQLFYAAERLPREALLTRLADPAFDFRRTLLVESPLPHQLTGQGSGTVQVVATTINAVDLDVQTDRPAVLLITDSYSKGWRAYALHGADAKEYPVVPADHAFLGIPLEQGRHRLRLEYRPRSLRLGLLLTTLGVLGLLALLFRYRSPPAAKMATLSSEQ